MNAEDRVDRKRVNKVSIESKMAVLRIAEMSI